MNTKKTRHLSKGLHIRLEDDIDDNTNGNFSITRSLSATNLDLNKRGRTTAKFEMEMVQRTSVFDRQITSKRLPKSPHRSHKTPSPKK